MIRLRRPSDDELARLAASVRSDPFSYGSVGATATDDWPLGYRHDRHSVDLGSDELFEPAVERLRQWQAHRGAGVHVGSDGPLAEGTAVALAAPLPVGFVIATCRIVYVEDGPGSFAWAYGTLAEHPEMGEERFALVARDGRTIFQVGAFSRPHHWLTKTAGPLARRLQLRAADAYLRAMRPDHW